MGELEHGRGTPMSSRELTEWRVYWSLKAADQEMASAGSGDSAMPPAMGHGGE